MPWLGSSSTVRKHCLLSCPTFRLRPPLRAGHRCWARFPEEVLAELLSLDDDALKAQVLRDDSAISTSFMIWLADHHDATRGEAERRSIHLLGGKIMSLKCGLEPCSAEDVLAAEAAEDAAEEKRLRTQTRRFSVTKWRASREHILLERAKHIEALVQASRERAAADVVGKPSWDGGSMQQLQRSLQAAEVSHRILDVLLDIPDRAARRAALPDAFSPPESDSVDQPDAEEMLHTTPLRLSQSIRTMQLSLQTADSASTNGSLPRSLTSDLPRSTLAARLDELFEDVMDYWQPQFETTASECRA